jgi:hypothetical protein
MLKNADEFSVDLFRNTLDVVHQQYDGDSVNPAVHTLYSTIYDLKQGVIYLYYLHDFQHVVTFDLKKELAKGIHSYDIPSLFPTSYSAIKLGGKTPAELADLRADLQQAVVSPEVLKQYEGSYQLDVLSSYLEGQISVKSENNRLFFRQPWMPWVEGIAQSDKDFTYLFSDPNGNLHKLNFSFVKDASGQVTKMEVSADETEKMSATKLSAALTKVDTYLEKMIGRLPFPAWLLFLLPIASIFWQASRLKGWRKEYQTATRAQQIIGWLGTLLDLLICTGILLFLSLGNSTWYTAAVQRPDFGIPLLTIAFCLGGLGCIRAVRSLQHRSQRID